MSLCDRMDIKNLSQLCDALDIKVPWDRSKVAYKGSEWLIV